MTNEQKIIIEILNKAIRGEKINPELNEKINWEEVLKIAIDHKVELLISEGIEDLDKAGIPKDIASQMKLASFINKSTNAIKVKRMINVIKDIENKGIEIIALKGVIVRNYYPKSSLRTMSDADILVRKEDLEKVSKILYEHDYKELESTNHHIEFKNNKEETIELHWDLTSRWLLKEMPEYVDKLWERRIVVNGLPSMSYDDLVFHLILHMTSHFIKCGFGLRQLLDLVLVIENEGDNLDWEYIFTLLNKCKINKIAEAILVLCEKLFNLEIPEKVNKEGINNKRLDIFINYIFDSGVYGKASENNLAAARLAFYMDNTSEGTSRSGIWRIMFPPIEKLSNRYNYAKKHKILTPVAWLHYLIRGIFNQEFKIFNSLGNFINTIRLTNNKNKLLKWLQL